MSSNFHARGAVDEDIIISTNSFDCMRNAISKAGFREGAIAGKEKSVQTGFDAGYEEGYAAGKSLGYLKGLHFAKQVLMLKGADVQRKTDESCQAALSILENSSKGVCQLCIADNSASQLEDETESTCVEPLQEIVKKQAAAVENALTVLHTAYKFPLKEKEKDLCSEINLNTQENLRLL